MRRMFAEIDADVYLMVDGDGTYDPSAAPDLVSLVYNDRVDMAIGARRNVTQNAHRAGHAFGNRLFNRIFAQLFGQSYVDIFSGYRAFSRRFVKAFLRCHPALRSRQNSRPRKPDAPASGRDRDCLQQAPEGSESKLRSGPRRDSHPPCLCLSAEGNKANPVFWRAGRYRRRVGPNAGLSVARHLFATGLSPDSQRRSLSLASWWFRACWLSAA